MKTFYNKFIKSLLSTLFSGFLLFQLTLAGVDPDKQIFIFVVVVKMKISNETLVKKPEKEKIKKKSLIPVAFNFLIVSLTNYIKWPVGDKSNYIH